MLERLKAWADAKYGRSFKIEYDNYLCKQGESTMSIWIYDYKLHEGIHIKDVDFPDDILEQKVEEQERKEYEKLKAQFEGSESNA